MQNQFLVILQLIGKQAAAQLSGPWSFVAGFVLTVVVRILDYMGVKHELRKQADKKLEDFEKAIVDLELTKEQKDEARRNFLK